MHTIQKLAWGYAALFFSVVAVGYIPGFTDSQGYLFGSFKIDPIDDVVHGVSGTWAALSAWQSASASRFFFRAFGSFYTLDAFVGFFTGYAIIDILTANFTANAGFSITDFGSNFLVNAPHFIIGPLAMFIGFILYRTLETRK